MNARRVLVCDEEPQALRAVALALREAGYEPVLARTGEQALDRAAYRPPDAAVVDLLLGDLHGVELCRRLREWSAMPILVLSAVDDEGEAVRALEAGADHFLTKPFGPRELIARLEAVLRRCDVVAGEPALRFDALQIDFCARRVLSGDREVHLTPIEYDLLAVLVRNRDRLMTHRSLLRAVWGPGHDDDTHTLRTHIGNLRRKIEPGGRAHRFIRTQPGVGYRFEQPAGGRAVAARH